MSSLHWFATARAVRVAPCALLVVTLLSACGQSEDESKAKARPVRSITVEKHAAGQPISLTGRIEAEDEVVFSFRIGGRLLRNDASRGEALKAGQLIAELEPQNEQNALRAARAALAAAQAQLTQARNHFERQDTLLGQGWTTKANHDDAQKALQTAKSNVDAAEAQLKTAYDVVSYTELKADAPGVVTAVGPGAGEVVQAGQMIAVVAREDGRDAVFDVPAQMIRSLPSDPKVTIALADDPKVTATGRVREVAPQADPETRTFEVKVGLSNPPAAMRLGATVNARLETEALPMIQVPASALTQFNSQPAVWIVDPASGEVSIRNIDVLRYGPATVAVSGGLEVGDVVVTAGVQSLHPGQKVRLLGSQP